MDPRASSIALQRITDARCHMARADGAMGELHRLIDGHHHTYPVGELRAEINFALRQLYRIAGELGLAPPSPGLRELDLRRLDDLGQLTNVVGLTSTEGRPSIRPTGSYLHLVEGDGPSGSVA